MNRILTIDNNQAIQKYVSKSLGNDFEISKALDCESGLNSAIEAVPDIILLSEELESQNNFELCSRIKNEPALHGVPIIFLSFRSGLEERLECYEHGAADYIVMPLEAQAFRAKLKVVTDCIDCSNALHTELSNFEKTAHVAMTTSSELGRVIQFVEQCFDVWDFNTLGRETVQLFSDLQLSTSAMLISDTVVHWFGDKGYVSPLEMEVINLFRDRDRINDFRSRTVINYPNISVMVKNMPLDDPDRYGRIKDLIPAILSSLNSKIDAMNREENIRKTSADLAETFDAAGTKLDKLFLDSGRSRKIIHHAHQQMFDDIQMQLPHMGLDDDQESFILGRLDYTIQEVTRFEVQAEETSAEIESILSELHRLSEVQKNLSREPEQQVIQESNFTDNSGSIELF